MQGKARDIDGVNMWPALSGENATSPRPILPTTQWSLLHDTRESGGRLLKIITGSYRSNWFLANGSQVNDTDTPCVEGEASGVPEAGILPCPGLVSASTATPEADQRVSASRISELAGLLVACRTQLRARRTPPRALSVLCPSRASSVSCSGTSMDLLRWLLTLGQCIRRVQRRGGAAEPRKHAGIRGRCGAPRRGARGLHTLCAPHARDFMDGSDLGGQTDACWVRQMWMGI